MQTQRPLVVDLMKFKKFNRQKELANAKGVARLPV